MSKYSDHNKPQFDITKYLPEVYRSNVNDSLFNMAFNRHLTKDDTQRVAGVIGESSAAAIVKRQIQESTPHRQAYQLAPTMYSKVGMVETALSYKAFLQQLSLMGVSTTRLPKWADTLQFNWIPPVNLDMLVNYQDYFWMPRVPGEESQYFTIENRCSKLKSKLSSYETMLESRGSTFPVAKIDLTQNEFIMDGRFNDLFVDGFVFFTSGTTNVNLSDRFWTVDSVTFDESTQQTKIKLIEPIAIVSETEPTTEIVGRWWFTASTKTLRQWNGSAWVGAHAAVAVSISLAELRAVYQSETNCACTSGLGWDMTLWDDNQIGAILWDADLFSTTSQQNPPKRIDFATQAEWLSWNIAHPQTPAVVSGGVPVDLALWYDTTNDQLKQYATTNPLDGGWVPKFVTVVNSFSTLRAQVTGVNRWDQTIGCEPQILNQWSEGNRWIHKTQVKSFGGVKRAQMPILEYNSGLELNRWTRVTRTWKYRAEPGLTFVADSTGPQRIELEPIKGYSVAYTNGNWYVYLFDNDVTTNRDINYTGTFVPGFQFKVVDDTAKSDTYTVHTSEFREMTVSEPSQVIAVTGTGVMCTVVRLVETDYASELTGGGVTNVRIEPRLTSKGTPWRGYHIHWTLDADKVTYTPETDQSLNVYRQRDEDTEPTVELVAGNVAYTSINFQPALQTQIELGYTYQEMVMTTASVRTIDLAPRFRCTGSGSNFFAMPGTSELRVYVNGVRQYGNYAERTAVATPDYTAVGTIGQSSAQITYVVGIDFERPLKALDVVRMEVGPASFKDMGMYCVPVRTVEDEVEFTAAVAAGTQPSYRVLSQYILLEQVKAKANQTPLFNVYDVVNNEVVKAARVFSYKEDSAAEINTILQSRIATGESATDYIFVQDLIDRDNNLLYGYRDNSITASYWYNPVTNKVLYWDGDGWTDSIASTVNGIVSYRAPTVSSTEPQYLLGIVESLWFDTRRNKLYKRSSTTWSEVGITISITDPTLRTIWRHGSNNEHAVPKYVDKNKNEITVGSPDGDWSLVDQWTYNPEHENRKELRFSELFTHVNSILLAQPKTPGMQGGGVYALSQADYNYGVGGTIKEHNGSFDTLISAVNVSNITPPGVVEYAAREYASSLLQLRDMFNKLGPKLLTDDSNIAILDFNGYLTSRMIALYESNDALAQIFGDSSSYDQESGAGVKNWVASAPMFSLAKAVVPYLNKTGQYVELVHHDGHRSVVSLTSAEIDKVARALCNTMDTRVSATFGKISTLAPPATQTAMSTEFGGLRRGAYWYRATGSIHKLYRFDVFTVGVAAPPNVINGLDVVDGSMYYNLTSEAVFQKVNGAWVAITTLGAGDVSPLWREIDLSVAFGEVLLEIEKRLYDVSPTDPLVFNYSTLQSTVDDKALYDKLSAERFATYARNNEITGPLVNVFYTPADPFSWNYASSAINTPPRSGAVPELASSWKEIYTKWYGTPYPHLEPWKLQGFTDKPTWWDGLYKATTGSRRWIYTHATNVGMWENIRTGVVPAGELLADGFTVSSGTAGQAQTYNYFCVNISDSDLGTFPPDALLPPYFAEWSVSDTTLRSIYTDYVTQLVSLDADFVFGDGSPIEWEWRNSLDYTYDQMIIAFAMQPMRFTHACFGPRFTSVDGLNVERLFKQVYSHQDVMFHGDVYGENETYASRGLNQWYVNYNRRSGFNTNGEFRQLWAGWKPTMTYQFGGIIDTNTFEIANKYIDIIPHDYNILLVNNGVFKDMWMDAFEVSLISIPPPIIQYNNQNAWKLEVDSLASSSRSINYYGVKEYSCLSDVSNSSFNVIETGCPNQFIIAGNQLVHYPPGTEFDVTGSEKDDGTYTISDATYNSTTNRTTLTVLGVVPSGCDA